MDRRAGRLARRAYPGCRLRYPVLLAAAIATATLVGCYSHSTSGNSASTQVSSNSPTLTILGYYEGDSDSFQDAVSSSTPVNAVSMDVLGVQSDGSLMGSLPDSLIAKDSSTGKLSFACISNFGATDFDPALGHSALVTNRAAVIFNIVQLAKTKNLTGINIDFEGLYTTDRDNYSSFVAQLADQLHAIDSILVLSIPAKSADDPNDTWTWPFDYAVLGKHADYLQVMTYDENVPGGPPGPVSGSDWMQATLKYAASQIPPNKILLGLPAYGYDWDLTDDSGVQVDWKDTNALIDSTGAVPHWNGATDTDYFDYTAADGHAHQVWYDTPAGISVKAGYARSLKLGGVSVWALGFEDASFWSAVQAGIQE